MENPESLLVYTEYNRKIELVCKWAYIGAMYVSLGAGNVALIITGYVNYYLLDVQDEPFKLTSPITYVAKCIES